MISLVWSPMRSIFSAFSRSADAKMTTAAVPSPASRSCASAALTNICAAGWMTSSSRRMVAASDVTNSLPSRLTTILRRAWGPRLVDTSAPSCVHASMFLSTAASTPEMCFVPSFSSDDRPDVGANDAMV